LIRGELATARNPKQRVIYESGEPITALGFTETAKQTLLFIVSTNKVMTYLTVGKGQKVHSPQLLDALGCAWGCVTFRQDGEMVAVRDDGIYMYGAESRGAVFALEGKKSSVALFKEYIVVTSPPTIETKGIRSAIANVLSRTPDATEQSKITILDIENKFIVHSGSVTGAIKEIFSSWGNLYVITTDGEVSLLL